MTQTTSTNEVNATKKILFVDDDKLLLDMYVLKFSKNGYDVKAADNAEMCLKLIKEGFVPDVLLVDIIMPGMDGLELIETIKKEHLAPNTVIIFLTNQSESDDINRARKLAADGFIVKATTIPSEVLSEVEKIYSSKKR